MPRRSFALVVASLVAVGVGALASNARADFGPKFNDDWFLPVGFNAAAAFGNSSRPAGFVGGVEASVVHIDSDLTWIGAYGDATFDTGISRTRLTIGPEFGAACFGFDGGFAMLLGGDKPYPGFVLRPMLTFAFFTLYTRFVDFPGEPVNTSWAELGVMFKIPVPISVSEPPRPPVTPQRPLHEPSYDAPTSP